MATEIEGWEIFNRRAAPLIVPSRQTARKVRRARGSIMLAGEPSRSGRDHDFDACLLQHLTVAWLDAAVGHQHVDLFKVADDVTGRTLELAAVDEQDQLLGPFDETSLRRHK